MRKGITGQAPPLRELAAEVKPNKERKRPHRGSAKSLYCGRFGTAISYVGYGTQHAGSTFKYSAPTRVVVAFSLFNAKWE